MVGDEFPGTAALHRRHQAQQQQNQQQGALGETLLPLGLDSQPQQAPPQVAATIVFRHPDIGNERRFRGSGLPSPQSQQQQQRPSTFRLSHMYVLLSALVAILAIVTSTNTTRSTPLPQQTTQKNPLTPSIAAITSSGQKQLSHQTLQLLKKEDLNSVENVAKAAAAAVSSKADASGLIVVINEAPAAAKEQEFDLLRPIQNLFGNSVPLDNTQTSEGGGGGNLVTNLFRSKKDKHANEELASHSNSKEVTQGFPFKLEQIFSFPLKWLFPHLNTETKASSLTSSTPLALPNENYDTPDPNSHHYFQSRNPFLAFVRPFIDPSLISPASASASATDVIDKVLTSTPRLLAIANLLLGVTYLLHSAVADFFLNGDDTAASSSVSVGNNSGDTTAAILQATDPSTRQTATPATAAAINNRIHRSGRERMGGYLLFKLLLISAIVEPDTLDLLILLSWYTFLSFLRSLAHLAGVTTTHTAQSGQPPRRGVLKLLLVVLGCDFTAVAVCAGLFHGAGWSMVLLLTADCAFLAVDVMVHLTRYVQQAMEERHSGVVGEVERRQLRLHVELRRREEGRDANALESDVQGNFARDDEAEQGTILSDVLASVGEEEETATPIPEELRYQNVDVGRERASQLENVTRDESRRLDRELELLEASHTRRLAVLDHVVFVLEMVCLSLTIVHFLHIWSLHGVTFGLVDGVLALHLHSAISGMGKKVAERRNLNRIARDLDGLFEDASELEMRKASATGDVCCICLGTMSTGNVKKVGCGHLYHTSCLREVVERARSIEAARCPLCRASVVDGRQDSIPATRNNNGLFVNTATNRDATEAINEERGQNRPPTTGNNGAVDGINDALQRAAALGTGQQLNQGERALFRFSTESILPAWLPLPAFSFEVVRRPLAGETIGNDNRNTVGTQQLQRDAVNTNLINDIQQTQQQQVEPPFWRRLLLFAGAIPLTPEQEAATVAQLVDMFPQYDRADLLRELRDRRSAEAVAEAILIGVFSGIPRRGALGMDVARPPPLIPGDATGTQYNQDPDASVRSGEGSSEVIDIGIHEIEGER